MSLRERFADRFRQRWADRIADIASEELAAGVEVGQLKARVAQRLRAESGGSRPLLDFLLKLLEDLLPYLIQILIGGITGGAMTRKASRAQCEVETQDTEGLLAQAKQRNAPAFAPADALARQLGVPAQAVRFQLVVCIAKRIGWAAIWKGIRESPDDWLNDIMTNIDIDGVMECLFSSFGEEFSGSELSGSEQEFS